jgi:hypothetical protein
MDEPVEILNRVNDLVGAHAKDATSLDRPGEVPRVGVLLHTTDTRDALCAIEPVFALLQRRLHAFECSNGIVTHHAGTIGVQSQPGAGTEFILTFPAIDRFQKTGQIEIAAA